MTRPAENQARGEAPTVAKLQQTVETALDVLLKGEHPGWTITTPAGSALHHDPERCEKCVAEADARAALRDLVAQTTELGDCLRETKNALARERGGGTPLTRKDYIALNDRASALLARLDGAR